MSLRIDKETYQTMKEVSEKTSLAKSTIARIALETFLRNVKKEGLTLPLEK
ncbi:ribbon-helix-helix domain-containing protein [Akkermansia sp.]|uniref:ribbon-helix-helix domain-containing protein n=1 Tax=Akkermansia sp. TaxID=1872421 RepID=UPI0025BD7E62|nr:ribbon-helix-helix domain-containing protein [Akkermansia sp.]